MNIHATEFGNRLLASLSSADFALLAPYLKEMHFEQGALLQAADAAIEQVYFPRSGVISLLAVMQEGNSIETASTGRKGALNIMAGLGSRRSPCRAVMQIAGDITTIAAAKFHAAVETSPTLRDTVVRYTEAQTMILQQTAACNALHHVDQRFCRWLLQIRDRCESNVIPLTQEMISEIMCVQRTTVTAIARAFKSAGLFRYSRGKIEILDGAGIERRSCECYQTMKTRTETGASDNAL